MTDIRLLYIQFSKQSHNYFINEISCFELYNLTILTSRFANVDNPFNPFSCEISARLRHRMVFRKGVNSAGDVWPIGTKETGILPSPRGAVWALHERKDGESGMVLSEDEVPERRWSPLESSQVFPILRPSPSPLPFSADRLLLGWSVDLQPWVARHFQEDTPPPPRSWKS